MFLSRPFRIGTFLFEHIFKIPETGPKCQFGFDRAMDAMESLGGGGDITKLEACIESLEKDFVSILEGLFSLFETRLHAFVVTM